MGSLPAFGRGEDSPYNSLALVPPKYWPSVVPELVPRVPTSCPGWDSSAPSGGREGGLSAAAAAVSVPGGEHGLAVSELRTPQALRWRPCWLWADLTFTWPETPRV